MSTQGSVTVTLNVITKDLARYSGGFCILYLYLYLYLSSPRILPGIQSDFVCVVLIEIINYLFSGLDMKHQICEFQKKRFVLYSMFPVLWYYSISETRCKVSTFIKKNQTNCSTQGQGRRRGWGARYWSSCHQGVLVNQMCGLLNYIRIFVNCSWTRIYLSSTIKVTEPFSGTDYSFLPKFFIVLNKCC